jgi:two-component system sensor histidine kinase VicK
VERIKFSCDRINSILEVTPDSNITLAEKLQLHPESIDLQDVIYSAIERTRFEMLEKRITLDRTRSQYLPTVYADRDALEQVLISLLENAIAFTPEEVKVSKRTQKKKINGEPQRR